MGKRKKSKNTTLIVVLVIISILIIGILIWGFTSNWGKQKNQHQDKKKKAIQLTKEAEKALSRGQTNIVKIKTKEAKEAQKEVEKAQKEVEKSKKEADKIIKEIQPDYNLEAESSYIDERLDNADPKTEKERKNKLDQFYNLINNHIGDKFIAVRFENDDWGWKTFFYGEDILVTKNNNKIEIKGNENDFIRDTLEPSLLYDSYMKKYLEFLEKVDISKDENIFDKEDRTVYLFKYIKGNQRLGLFKQPKKYDRMKLPQDVLFGIKKKTNKEFAKNYP